MLGLTEIGHTKVYQEGRQEGRQEGLQEKALEIARKLLASGMTVEEVAAFTSIPLERVRQLQSSR